MFDEMPLYYAFIIYHVSYRRNQHAGPEYKHTGIQAIRCNLN